MRHTHLIRIRPKVSCLVGRRVPVECIHISLCAWELKWLSAQRTVLILTHTGHRWIIVIFNVSNIPFSNCSVVSCWYKLIRTDHMQDEDTSRVLHYENVMHTWADWIVRHWQYIVLFCELRYLTVYHYRSIAYLRMLFEAYRQHIYFDVYVRPLGYKLKRTS